MLKVLWQAHQCGGSQREGWRGELWPGRSCGSGNGVDTHPAIMPPIRFTMPPAPVQVHLVCQLCLLGVPTVTQTHHGLQCKEAVS